MKRFRGGLVIKAHTLAFHSTLGLRVIKQRRRRRQRVAELLRPAGGERGPRPSEEGTA